MSEWRIVIPRWKPTLLNALMEMHWSKRSKVKKSDYAMIATYAMLAGVPKATGHRKVGVEVILAKSKSGREPDPDAVNKVLRDGLAAAGLIVDDSRKWATFSEPVIRRGERATVITLEDVP
jgi:hypothetical protein